MKGDVSFDPYDSADYLETTEDAVLYLEAAFEEADNDPSVIATAFDTIVRSGNTSDLAHRIRMSLKDIYRELSEEGYRSFSSVMRSTS